MGDISVDLSENIPGDHSDRKTPRGELHWIFTAVTDTIAWNTLPSNVFQKLFREDLLAASLFRWTSCLTDACYSSLFLASITGT
jgi:regulatory associated protein of mTOR